MNESILLTAGGSGGHLFPAQALAAELGRRGYIVELATDERADKYGADFPARRVHIVQSATLGGKNPLALVKTLIKLLSGTWQARRIVLALRPKAVVGFGGYPTFPPMLAARLTNTPSILHEANGVMGRANHMLARGVTAIATSVPLKDLDKELEDKAVLTGNPLRDSVIACVGQSYPHIDEDGPFNLLVFGGSQGARVFSDLMPEAIALLPENLRARLRLTQQCRPEDLTRVGQAYMALKIDAELNSFFTDMPARIAANHLTISRSGASTVSELTALGRPSLLVPLPNALDNDQLVNARALEDAGAAKVLPQKEITAESLAHEIETLMTDPQKLIGMSEAARGLGQTDAVGRLADLVERVVRGETDLKGERG